MRNEKAHKSMNVVFLFQLGLLLWAPQKYEMKITKAVGKIYEIYEKKAGFRRIFASQIQQLPSCIAIHLYLYKNGHN